MSKKHSSQPQAPYGCLTHLQSMQLTTCWMHAAPRGWAPRRQAPGARMSTATTTAYGGGGGGVGCAAWRGDRMLQSATSGTMRLLGWLQIAIRLDWTLSTGIAPAPCAPQGPGQHRSATAGLPASGCPPAGQQRAPPDAAGTSAALGLLRFQQGWRLP